MTRFLLKAVVALGILIIPSLLIMRVFTGIGDVTVGPIDPASPNYPDAVERLEAASQILVTIALAVLAGTGLVIAKSRSGGALSSITAGLIFICAVMSMYFATKFGSSAALTIAAGQGDIATLRDILDYQAISTLVAGLLVGALVACVEFRSEDATDAV